MYIYRFNIGKFPIEALNTSGFALGVQYLPRDLASVKDWKTMIDFSIVNKGLIRYLIK